MRTVVTGQVHALAGRAGSSSYVVSRACGVSSSAAMVMDGRGWLNPAARLRVSGLT